MGISKRFASEEYVNSIIPSSEDITLMLAEMNVIEPMTDENGEVLVDENGAILV